MTDLTKVIILGSQGMVGQAIDFGIKLNHQECDITNPESIRETCDRYDPSAILSLASIDLRVCEEDPVKAYKVNALGVLNLAREAKRRDSRRVRPGRGDLRHLHSPHGGGGLRGQGHQRRYPPGGRRLR